MKYLRNQTPCYVFALAVRPTSKGKGKQVFFATLRSAAKREISIPIRSDDMEMEIFFRTNARKGEQIDVDNINNPTLDALKGIAYVDDSQVRSVTSTVFRSGSQRHPGSRNGLSVTVFSASAQDSQLLEDLGPDALLIKLYSDSRLKDLGGEKIEAKRSRDWFAKEFRKPKKKIEHSKN